MSINPQQWQRIYQQQYRKRKWMRGLCMENGCQTPTPDYRCDACKKVHARQEQQRRARDTK